MARPRIQRKMNLYIEGIGFQGVVEEVTLPVITRIMEESRGAGQDGTIKEDLGQEAMQATLVFKGTDHTLLKNLSNRGLGTAITLRSSERAQGQAPDKVVYKMTGVFSTYDLGAMAPGTMNKTTVTAEIDHFEIIDGGENALFIDVENGIFRVFDEDWLDEERDNIGLN